MINDPYQHQFVQEPTNHSWLHATPAKDTLSNLLWYLHTSSGYWSARPKEILVYINNFAPKIRVSEPACFGAAPAPAPGKREHDFGIIENWLQSVINTF